MAFEQVLPRRLARWVTAEPDWEQVYAEQLPRVLNFFRYRLGDTADVEDLTARTFEKAWNARHRYRSDVAGFATWLLTIARNIAIDHLRARQRHEPLDEAAAVVDVVQEPGPPVKMASLDEAAAAAGMTLAVPQWLPDKTQLLETSVVGERAARVTAPHSIGAGAFTGSNSARGHRPSGARRDRPAHPGTRAEEAKQFAQSIDWHSTLLVPVPPKAS